MYIARQKRGPKVCYFIRESYFSDGFWRSRDLFNLGPDPSRYIVYPGGNSFYIDERIIEELAARGVKTDQWELEDLFLPFVKPHIRRVLGDFAYRSFVPTKRLPRREQLALQEGYHLFDCRRLLFLKFGGTNVDPLLKRPLSFLNVLKDKSRDEIEQHIMRAEANLRPRETLAYIYASFGLAKYFAHRATRFMPEAQALEELDQAFLKELCFLLEDEAYRMGLSREEVLRDYLSRYVVMHFDRLEETRRFFEERQARLAERHYYATTKVVAQAASLFGVSEAELMRMGKEELGRLFRRRARELHPDQGGDHEDFIKLRKLYEELMAVRGFKRAF